MAENLASIFGAEKNGVNCPFYFKIGACRHGVQVDLQPIHGAVMSQQIVCVQLNRGRKWVCRSVRAIIALILFFLHRVQVFLNVTH
ncbi:unnamed protein product [Sphagnum troendelagicum]|uniref:Uncharacterized protein n=1 Tax=Sphagnum troendelagicum TaxID=128251 RepID=A0ABP0TV23_9BRYO